MKNILLKVKHEEDGVTLVELLAAIAILSIIVTSFLAFFIQAANTNKMTNEVNEATFLAQERMEQLTYYSSNKSLEDTRVDLFDSKVFITTDETVDEVNVKIDIVKIEESKEGKPEFNIKTVLKKNKDSTSSIYTGIVTVSEGVKIRAKMETRLPFDE